AERDQRHERLRPLPGASTDRQHALHHRRPARDLRPRCREAVGLRAGTGDDGAREERTPQVAPAAAASERSESSRSERGWGPARTEKSRRRRGAAGMLAVRSLLKTPGFSTAVVLTLTLGLAANAAFFAVVDALLLRPLPYTDPDRLLVLFEVQPGSRARALVSPPDYLSWKAASRTLAGVAAFRPWGFVLNGRDGAERITGARVSASLLHVLGVRPIAGRDFLAEEDVYGASHVAIVSYGTWRDRLGAPASLDGRTIVLGGAAYTIVGVLPPDFRMPGADVLVPLAL